MDVEKRIPTNLRTLLILEVIGRSDHALSPTQINEELGLPKQTIHRLVSTLVDEGFLIREADRNKFRPTRRLRMMGAGLLHASRANIMRHQLLQSAANQIGEAINFVVPEEEGMKYLDRIETDWPFRIQLPRGSNVPFHTTASGKCFMATLPKATRLRFIDTLDLRSYTEKSFTDKNALADHLAGVARQGFATDHEEFIDNMSAVAVPILDEKKRFLAALATHGPKERMEQMDQAEIVGILKDHATQLQAAIMA